MDDIAVAFIGPPYVRGNFMKSMWILGFDGSPEPTELDGLRHGHGRGFSMLPSLLTPKKGELNGGGRNRVHANARYVCH